jgi:hypothetical protein
MAEQSEWFEEAWHYRETVLYPQQVGKRSDGSIITIPYVAFAQLGAERVDPRWLHCGVLVFPPQREQTSFTFVTSGLSSAWDESEPHPESISGLGIELRLDNRADEDWAKDVLLRLAAMQLLIGCGKFTGARLLGHGDRVRVGSETFGEGSAMTSLLVTKLSDLKLPSGTFEMLQLFAITDRERELGATQGAEVLMQALRQNTTYPVNDITRQSVV